MSFLKKVDCFSPYITLYFRNTKRHSSIASGILSIIHYTILILVIFQNLFLLFSHNSFSFFYSKVYLDELDFNLNKNNFNHSILIKGTKDYDPRAISVIGTYLDKDEILEDDEIKNDYWTYEKCKDNEDFLCIKNYYNTNNDKVNLNDKKFVYPSIVNKKGVPYAILIQTCQGTEDNENFCYSKEEINKIRAEYLSIEFDFVDSFINLDNYKNSFVKHSNVFQFDIPEKASLVTDINFTLSIMKTKKGMIFGGSFEEKGVLLDDISNKEVSFNKKVISLIRFQVSKKVEFYEKRYSGLNNTLTNIIVIEKVSWLFFFMLNYFINKFTVYYDFGILYESNYTRIVRLNSTSMIQDNIKQKSIFCPGRLSRSKIKLDISHFSIYSQSEYSFLKFICSNFKCKRNLFIENLKALRREVLNEEKLIKYHLIFTTFDTYGNSFFERPRQGTSFLQSFFALESKKSLSDNKNDIGNSSELLKKQNFVQEDH